jgi:hypothetical protein
MLRPQRPGSGNARTSSHSDLRAQANHYHYQRTTRHPGYATSQRKCKRVEEIFGWVKTVGGPRKTGHRGVARVDWIFSFAPAAYNFRMRNLALIPA